MRKPLIAIGLSQFGLSLMQTIFMFYYVKVYINEFHVNTKWFNIAQSLFMIWNAINDPIFGYLQDVPGFWMNNRLRVIKVLSPFLVISFIFMWIPWDTKGSDAEGIHLILSLFLYDAFFSAIGVAWGALFADTTKNQPNVRVKALKYSQIAILVSVFSIAVTEKLSLSLKDFDTFQNICFFVSIISFICLWFAGKSGNTSRYNENHEAMGSSESLINDDSKNLTFKENIQNSIVLTKEVLSQKKFIAIIIANFFQTARSIAHMNFAAIITEVIIPHDILPSGSLSLSLFFAVLTLGPQIVLILNEKLIANIGAWRVVSFSYIVSFFSGFMIIFSSNPLITMLFMFIDCITVHTIAPLFNIMISDFVDEDARKNNRAAGIPSIIFSLNALIVKPAQSFAPMIIVNFLNSAGYQEYLKTKTTSPELKNAVILVLFLTPLVIGAIQFVALRLFYGVRNYKNFLSEMLIALTVAVDALRPIVPCALLSFSMVPFQTCAIAIGGISWVVPKHVSQTLDNMLYKSYMRLCLFVFENLSGVEIHLHGDHLEEIIHENDKTDNALVLSNHQSNVDWIIPVMLAARHGKQGSEQAFRVMVKQSIHLVPMFGWYIFQHGYIYVRRFGDFIGEPVRRQLQWLNDSIPPYWLLIFPEGTRLSAKKQHLLENSNSFLEKMGFRKMQNVLCPRSGGLQLALDNLPTLDAIYDMTVLYGQMRIENRRGIAPGMFEFCCGWQQYKQLHIHIKRHNVSEIPREKNNLRGWIIDQFEMKERIIDELYSEKATSGRLLPSIGISRTLPSTVFFCCALIVPFFNETVRKMYILTFFSSPFLVGWLHLRRCV